MKSTVFYRNSRNSSSLRPTCLTQAQRRRFGFDPSGLLLVSHAPPQKRAACLTRLVCWRFASAVPALRALPATALAPLSHRLRSGFFLVHGFATTGCSSGRTALKRTRPDPRARPCRSSSSKDRRRAAATASGRLAGLLPGRRRGRGDHRLHHLEVAPAERRRPLHAGAQQVALDARELVPVDGPGQGLEGLDVAPGLLLHELGERLADLARALGRATGDRALDLKRRAGPPLRRLEAAAGGVLGPVDRLARHVDALVGGALAELGDVVGGLLGLGPGGLRHDGFSSRVSVEAGGGSALPCDTLDGTMLRCSKRGWPRKSAHAGNAAGKAELKTREKASFEG